jgi:hypothetical protein
MTWCGHEPVRQEKFYGQDGKMQTETTERNSMPVHDWVKCESAWSIEAFVLGQSKWCSALKAILLSVLSLMLSLGRRNHEVDLLNRDVCFGLLLVALGVGRFECKALGVDWQGFKPQI